MVCVDGREKLSSEVAKRKFQGTGLFEIEISQCRVAQVKQCICHASPMLLLHWSKDEW